MITVILKCLTVAFAGSIVELQKVRVRKDMYDNARVSIEKAKKAKEWGQRRAASYVHF